MNNDTNLPTLNGYRYGECCTLNKGNSTIGASDFAGHIVTNVGNVDLLVPMG